MQIPYNLINDLASNIGVGALILLAVFLIVVGREERLLSPIEQYSGTKTWALVGVLPMLTILYLFGVFSVILMNPVGDFLYSIIYGFYDDSSFFVKFSLVKNDLVAQEIIKLWREKDLLLGSFLAFLLLGFGGWSVIRINQSIKKILIAAIVVSFLLSGLSFYSGIIRMKQTQDLLERLDSPPKPG